VLVRAHSGHRDAEIQQRQQAACILLVRGTAGTQVLLKFKWVEFRT